ncbi:hypothetical protein MMC24_001703 [Lignoscripta atroalba]|nr:hypothetical protein [Lignoscripta atroalba]
MTSPPPSSSPEQQQQQQRTAEARAAFTASLNSVGSHFDADLRLRAKDIHANSAAIEKQRADVETQTKGLAKQSSQYQKMADESRGKLKELGDIQNWAEMIERDMLVVEETLRVAEAEGEGGRNADGVGKGKGKKAGRRGWF